jgi:hypothetical protein
MPKTAAIAPILPLEELIHSVRGCRSMLDKDLARIYGVKTSQLNQVLRRNADRFPDEFAFQITRQELTDLKSQFVISKTGRGGRRTSPWVFTEHGALMMACVLNSPVAVEASKRVIRAFIFLRQQMALNQELAVKLRELEGKVTHHDEAIEKLFEAIRQLIEPPLPDDRREIGFHIRETSPPYRVKTRCRT